MDDESVKSPAIFSLGTVQVLLSKVCGHWNYLRDHGIVLLLHAGKVLLFSSSSFFLFFLLFFSCSLVLKRSITTKSPTEIFVSHFEKMFPLRIFSVNVTKSEENCGFGHIYWRNPWWSFSFFVQCNQAILVRIPVNI